MSCSVIIPGLFEFRVKVCSWPRLVSESCDIMLMIIPKNVSGPKLPITQKQKDCRKEERREQGCPGGGGGLGERAIYPLLVHSEAHALARQVLGVYQLRTL